MKHHKLAPPTLYHEVKRGLDNGMLLEDAVEIALQKGVSMNIMRKARQSHRNQQYRGRY